MDNEILAGKKFPLDLIFVLLFTVIGAISAFSLPDGNAIRIIFGIPLLFFLPGYSIVAIFWPEYDSNVVEEESQNPSKNLDNVERLALSFGLSIVLVSFVGLLLSYSSYGLSLESVVLSNISIIFLLSIIAYYRRIQLPIEKRFSFNLSMERDKGITGRVFFVLLIVCVFVSGSILAYQLMSPISQNPYSAFYILDVNGTANNYPVNVTLDDSAIVIVGINNLEQETINYSVMVGIEEADNSMTVTDWNQEFDIVNSAIERNIILNHGELFEESFIFTFSEPGTYKVIWQLSIDGENTDHELHLWIDVNDNFS